MIIVAKLCLTLAAGIFVGTLWVRSIEGQVKRGEDLMLVPLSIFTLLFSGILLLVWSS